MAIKTYAYLPSLFYSFLGISRSRVQVGEKEEVRRQRAMIRVAQLPLLGPKFNSNDEGFYLTILWTTALV